MENVYLPPELAELLADAERRAQAGEPGFALKTGEICPGDSAAVIARSRIGIKKAFAMKWGFSLDKRLVFNARSESAADKPMFRESMQLRRCLVPATGYFEWDHREAKPPRYLFTPESNGAMLMAGLYRQEGDHYAFTILTRDAAPDIAPFHPRMPVILTGEQAARWLDHSCSPDEALNHAYTYMTWKRA